MNKKQINFLFQSKRKKHLSKNYFKFIHIQLIIFLIQFYLLSYDLVVSKENPKELNNYIKNELNRGFTYWDAKGGYDDSKTYIIYTALTKYELLKLERHMKKSNMDSFIIESEGIGIKGDFEKKF